MPVMDKKRKTWTGKVRLKGYRAKEKRGFLSKTDAKLWERSIKREIKESNIYADGDIDDRYERLKDKYSRFLDVKHNTIPDLIDAMFKDFNLDYTFNDVKKIIKAKKSAKTPAKIRIAVLKRDGYRCVLCGATADKTQLQVDHIVARDRGGLTEMRNLRTLCKSCNFGKNNLPYYVSG